MGVTGSILVSVLVLALSAMAFVLWSRASRRDPELCIASRTPVDRLVHTISGLTHGTTVGGNAVEVLENGHFFDALLESIREARHTVHFETYLWKEGVLGARLVEALCARARAGVDVRVLLDASGTRRMGKHADTRLKEAGCRVAKYHGRLANLGALNRRDHRKVTVLDGRVAFVGGQCIVDSWLGDAEDGAHFRDLGVKISGPVVHAVQSAFSENWLKETRELLIGEAIFPEPAPAGHVAAHVIYASGRGSPSAVKILHNLMIVLAQRRIWIQNPYFLPDPETMTALKAAVERGVDVRVMVPSASASDNVIVAHAGHRNFGELLAAGIRIFEYRKTLLHQKVMTVDGTWCGVGTTNFDDRGFEINDEITIGFAEPTLALQLERIFERDAVDAVELTRERWSQRGLAHRTLDQTLYLFNEQL